MTLSLLNKKSRKMPLRETCHSSLRYQKKKREGYFSSSTNSSPFRDKAISHLVSEKQQGIPYWQKPAEPNLLCSLFQAWGIKNKYTKASFLRKRRNFLNFLQKIRNKSVNTIKQGNIIGNFLSIIV